MGEKIMIGLACPDGTLSAELQNYLAKTADVGIFAMQISKLADMLESKALGPDAG